MERAKLKANAKEQLKGNFATLLVILIIILGITCVCTLIPVAGVFINFIIGPSFIISFVMVLLKIVRGEEISVNDTFTGLNEFIRALLLNVQKVSYTFFWTLLFVIPGIIKSYSYAMAEYILADNPDLTPSECITKSRMMMDGHKMEYFILQLSFIGWNILGIMTFGIALIWAFPYMQVTNANFYENLKNNEDTFIQNIEE